MSKAAEVPDPKPAGAARVLHTSDWHLGVACRGESRASDHQALIDEMVAIAGAAGPDLIVHTGDLFDAARPGYDDILRGLLGLRALAEIAPVVVLAGNHDSEGLFRVLDQADGHGGEEVWRPHEPCERRLRFLPKFCRPEAGAVATYVVDDGPNIRIGCLPFVHANRVLREFADLERANATYADDVKAIAGLITGSVFDGFDPADQVAIWASHLHVEGARLSSEREIHVSSAYATDTGFLDPRYGYLAFGHIHRPQDLPGGRGRYAGSILEVDFGEEAERKVVVVADVKPGIYPVIQPIELTAGRRLMRAKGTLAQLRERADEIGTAICEVTVEPDPDEPVEEGTSLARLVRETLPDATVVDVIDASAAPVVTLDEETSEGGEEETFGSSFRSYLKEAGSRSLGAEANAQRVAELFDELLTAVEIGGSAVIREDSELATLGIEAAS